MEITKEELAKEQQHLAKTLELIRKYISELGQELYDKEEKIKEFKELIWDTRHDMDPAEMRTMIGASDLEVSIAEARRKYFQKLFRIQENPYFASITFQAARARCTRQCAPSAPPHRVAVRFQASDPDRAAPPSSESWREQVSRDPSSAPHP